MLRAAAGRYERLPDDQAYAEDVFQNAASPIQMRTFNKSAYSMAYHAVQPHESGVFASDVERESQYRAQRSSLAGWRVGAMLSALIASLSLLLNLGVGIWALRTICFRPIFEVFRGDCGNVEKINTLVHLGINVISTALLSGSNYCMQCLSAPTRKDVDRAHAKGMWLDIGVPSIRNLQSISKKKVSLWWCLGLSSVPLHLMYVLCRKESHADC
jgi:hypothetical protein